MSSNTVKYSLIGAACTIGLGALGYFVYTQNNATVTQNKNINNLSKITTIKVIKQLKKEFFTSFSTMAMMAQQIKAQARGRASEAEVKEFVLMHPQINEEFKSSEQRAYTRHKVTEEEFQNAVEILFKDDAEVQNHRNELKGMFDKAASGQQLDIKAEIPQSLTSQNTLEIIEKIMKASCKRIQDVFKQLSVDGQDINMNDPQTLQALNNMKIDDVKAKILEEHGLEQYDDAGAKILQYATQKYSQENKDDFTQKMMQLELKHRKSMELIQQNPNDPDLVEKTFSEAVQPESSVFPGMGGPGGMGPFGGARKRQQDVVQGEKIERDEEKKSEKTLENQDEEKKEGEKNEESAADKLARMAEEAENDLKSDNKVNIAFDETEVEKLMQNDQNSEKQTSEKQASEKQESEKQVSEKQASEKQDQEVGVSQSVEIVGGEEKQQSEEQQESGDDKQIEEQD